MALFQMLWLRRFVRRHTRPIPEGHATLWKRRLSLGYMILTWNAFGYVIYMVCTGRADWAKAHGLVAENPDSPGMVGVFVGHPLDTLKVIQQTMNVSLMRATLLTYKYSGFHGFFRGMAFPLFTIGPSNAIFFCVYGSCMRQMQHNLTSERLIYTGHWMYQSFVAGCIAGFVQAAGTSPTELIKTILQAQVQYGNEPQADQQVCKDTRSCLRFIVKKDGLVGLYKGFLPLFIRDVPTSGIYMIVFEYYTHDIPVIEGSEYLHTMVGGGLAGIANYAFVTPFDAVKSRIQSDLSSHQERMYNSMTDCFVKTYQDEGIGIFFKGWWAITSRAFVMHSVTFLVYSAVMKWWQKHISREHLNKI